MLELMPWSVGRSMAALALVLAMWLAGIALGAVDVRLAALVLGLAAWMTIGLVYTAWRGTTEVDR